MSVVLERFGTHDLAEIYLYVGGFRIAGWGPDGGLEFDPKPRAEMTGSGDGSHAAMSRIRQPWVVSKVTVLQTSQSYARLAQLARQQDKEPKILALPFLARNANTGDKVASDQCVFLNDPIAPQGAKVGSLTFEIAVVNPDIKDGILN